MIRHYKLDPGKRFYRNLTQNIREKKEAQSGSRPYEDMTIPFGTTHKGKLVADCPDKYLKWLTQQEWMEEKFKKLWDMIGKELDYRKRFDIRID
jgi:uncharacterized protein (DUF3820 family)